MFTSWFATLFRTYLNLHYETTAVFLTTACIARCEGSISRMLVIVLAYPIGLVKRSVRILPLTVHDEFFCKMNKPTRIKMLFYCKKGKNSAQICRKRCAV